MADSVKETVIIVHGTWAIPDPAKRRWYEPVDGRPEGEPFTTKLDTALRERGSPARCWAHCTDGNSIFQWWPGENSWIARTRAASALGDYVAKLQKMGWRCHVVAHSHGGNVLLEALPAIVAPAPDVPHGKLLTLGTPFMDIRSPILRKSKRIAAVFWGFVSFIALLYLCIEFAAFLSGSQDGGLIASILVTSAFLAVARLAFLDRLRMNGVDDEDVGVRSPLPTYDAYGTLSWRRMRNLLRPSRTGRPGAELVMPKLQLLAISSRMDEAWQVLHHMRTVNNPLAVQTRLTSYVFSTFRSHMVRAAESELILGAKPFSDFNFSAKLVHTLLYSVFVLTLMIAIPAAIADFGWLTTLGAAIAFIVFMFALTVAQRELGGRPFNQPGAAPIRWYGRLMGAVTGVPISVLTYFIRRNAWPILLAMTMGLEGYRFELPSIAWKPETEHATVTYEDLLDSVVHRALDKRSAWIARHLGDFSQTFSRLAVTAADITSLLRMIEEDQTLVHAAYYSDDECIARIADWIANKR